MSRAQHPSALPAHETKHIAELEYPFQQHVFRLTQLDNGLSYYISMSQNFISFLDYP